jgi:hypothetical protein
MKKSNYWVISSLEILKNEVCFSEELTEKDAILAFMNGDFDDVIDVQNVKVEDAWVEEEDQEYSVSSEVVEEY